MFQFKKQVKETKEQVLQTEEKLNLHPLIHVSDSLLDYHKKLSLTEVNSLDELQEIQNTFQTVLEENKQLKEKLGEGVIVIASVQDGKVNLMATATDEAQKKGAHAGNLIKAIAGLVGGGGGGRPNMAQAGGKNPAGVDEALVKAVEVVKEQVQA